MSSFKRNKHKIDLPLSKTAQCSVCRFFPGIDILDLDFLGFDSKHDH